MPNYKDGAIEAGFALGPEDMHGIYQTIRRKVRARELLLHSLIPDETNRRVLVNSTKISLEITRRWLASQWQSTWVA
ncbi:hypothetical protein [Devosia sp.]|uniref:hypothetical protein n=1 Tax=Devosia sp. TaxID=1871048 RepID=UPI002735BB4F|nr:hypothetical protein [Devosia sp.]MDP2778925.1 hypothetical protein [Devosia sp.]